jgi:predicted RNase H-like nuclease (RuvC/YqgF family)
MTYNFDPAEIDVIEDDYTSNLSYDESENASTRRILGLCEHARELQQRVSELEAENASFRRSCAQVNAAIEESGSYVP